MSLTNISVGIYNRCEKLLKIKLKKTRKLVF